MSSINLRDLVREVIADELRPLIREQLRGDIDDSTPQTLFTQRDETTRIKSRRRRKTSSKSLAREGGSYWTQSEKKALIDNMLVGMSMKDCANFHGRTLGSIDSRLTHKKYGLLVGGLFGYRPIYIRTQDGSQSLDVDDSGDVAVFKDPESGNSSAGYVTVEQFWSYFKHRL